MAVQDLGVIQPVDTGQWPFNVPVIRQIAAEGLRLEQPITFFVGENGSGKSTVIEAIAEAYGFDVRGGHGKRRYAPAAPKGPLGQRLSLGLTLEGRRMKANKSPGFFLRTETALGVFEFMSDYRVSGYGDKHLGEVSHGEGYLQVLFGRFQEKGLYLLDEPEAALSFHSCLLLMEQLAHVVRNGSQVICVTHSPILSALPGAGVVEFGAHGFRRSAWEQLELVEYWRRYLGDPSKYLADMDL